MPVTPEGFSKRIDDLKRELVEQAVRVRALVEGAFDAAFGRDPEAAVGVIALDDEVDRVDVQLERRCVELLTDATAQGAALSPAQLRIVLTIVKVNNELERIADAGVTIAELTPAMQREQVKLPDTMRVMTNSLVGLLRDASAALDRNDPHLAKIVLASEDAVGAFKKSILRDAQARVHGQAISVDAGFLIQELSTQCVVMAGHCTNIAEQALYAATGTIVRHTGGHWEEVQSPGNRQP